MAGSKQSSQRVPELVPGGDGHRCAGLFQRLRGHSRMLVTAGPAR
ncbi:hypothetical protein [Zafaria cholistanensis]|nr:hypothetical protein [Zafaria cholistanensis]